METAPTLATFEPTLSATDLTTDSAIGSGAGVFNGSSDVLSVPLDVSEIEYTVSLLFKHGLEGYCINGRDIVE